MDTYDLDPSWKVVVLDDEESKLFFDGKQHFNKYQDEFLGAFSGVKEHENEPDTHDSFTACCIPCNSNKMNIEMIKEELSKNRLETFNSNTKFIQRLFRSYDTDHLILINDENFSMLLNIQRPKILGHEAFHIVEYEQYDQTHTGEEVDEYGIKLAEQYIESLTDEQRKREFKKICSHRKGKGKYGRLRLITKFR